MINHFSVDRKCCILTKASNTCNGNFILLSGGEFILRNWYAQIISLHLILFKTLHVYVIRWRFKCVFKRFVPINLIEYRHSSVAKVSILCIADHEFESAWDFRSHLPNKIFEYIIWSKIAYFCLLLFIHPYQYQVIFLLILETIQREVSRHIIQYCKEHSFP